MFRSIAITLTLCLATTTTQAALLSRAGGQAYYDDVLNITWLADANLAASNSFGVAGICPILGVYCERPGGMDWATANEWIAAMNTANYLGENNWRLPHSSTDWGFNFVTSEMGSLYYSTLGNAGAESSSGSQNSCGVNSAPYWCLTNTGPFSNLSGDGYWSGEENVAYSSTAWSFDFGGGLQSAEHKSVNIQHAWAVLDGDIAAVPIPATVWLFGSALGLMGWMRRKAIA